MNNRAQLSLELVMLILVVVVGALIVESNLPKQPFGSLEGPKSFKNATFGGFSTYAPVSIINNGGISIGDEDIDEDFVASNGGATANNTNITIKGSASLYLLRNGSKNGIPVYDGDVITNTGNVIKYYYLADNVSTISIFVRGSSITYITNVKYIKNIPTLEVDGTGNVKMAVVVDSVDIGTIGEIIVHGGGSEGCDIYFYNCSIGKIGSIVLSGGGSGNRNLIIDSCNITEFPENPTIRGNAKIIIYHSYVGGKYIDYKEIPQTKPNKS